MLLIIREKVEKREIKYYIIIIYIYRYIYINNNIKINILC